MSHHIILLLLVYLHGFVNCRLNGSLLRAVIIFALINFRKNPIPAAYLPAFGDDSPEPST